MIIKRLFLKKFGKFENKEITFSPKLNIFLGKNESGKSTISSAIKTFLYSDLTGKGKYKRKYIPLTEDKGFFDVNLSFCDNDYTALVTLGKTNGKTLIKVTDEATGDNLNIDTSKLGEHFFGVSEEMFDSVCHIKDIGSIPNITVNSEEVHNTLSKSENSIIDIDLSSVIKKVKDELSNLQKKTANGLIFPLEAELKKINDDIYDLNNIKYSLKDIDTTIDELLSEEKKVKKDIEDLTKKEEILSKYSEYIKFKEQQDIYDEIQALNVKASQIKTDFTAISEDELSRLRTLEEMVSKEPESLTLSIVSTVLSGVVSLVLSFINPLFALLFAITGILIFNTLKKSKQNKEREEIIKEYSDLLNKYKIENTNDYLKNKEDALRSENERKLLIEKAEFLKSRLKAEDEIKPSEKVEKPDYTKEEISQKKDSFLRRLTEITIKINSLNDRKLNAFNNMPDFHTLTLRRAECEKELSLLREREEIASDTLEILNKTNESFKSSYIPYLNREVKEILKNLFDEEVDYFNINSDLTCEIRKSDSDTLIPRDNFSNGTDALIYFAIRLAIYKLIFKDSKVPLILDDPFVELDDKRLKKVFEYIVNNIDSQVIYFTSHERIFNLPLAKDSIFRL